MGGKTFPVVLDTTEAVVIKKWKVKEGMPVAARQVIFIYDVASSELHDKQLKFKSTHVGTVRKILVREEDIVQPGGVLMELEECSHPTVMKDMCAECGTDLRKNDLMSSNASVPMVHSVPELKVSEEQAQIIGKADENRLLSDRKLVLLVDLDQTLIHTTNDNIPPNLKDVYHFRLYGSLSPWYHTRIRPRTHEFLEEISKYYELHICTFGARNYAHMIAMFLDPDGKYFSHRILSRDECFNSNSKTANLKALFPCGDNMVCIIDDREDVWNFAANLIHVKPYHFFKHTGDINAPPGLTKNENDEIDGFDFTDLDKKSKDENQKSLDKCNQKKSAGSVKTKGDSLGESTTDKDTEDETEMKSMPKVSDANQQEDIKRVTQDLQLSEDDDSDDDGTIAEPKSSDRINDDAEIGLGESFTKSSDSTVGDKVCEHSTTDADSTDDRKIDKTTDEDSSCQNVEAETNAGQQENLIEVEDTDDYLLYLQDILIRIHGAYYDEYDSVKKVDSKVVGIPDLKLVIPQVKQQVLKGCHLVLSGLVPSHIPLQQSKAYLVAISLGATVSPDISPGCTHLVAARPGTAKVNSSRRQKGITIVTPLWLWHCAERWERLDERLYPLGRGGLANRIPPAHCGSPEHNVNAETEQYSPALRNRTPSGRFIDTINPLLTFSTEDMKIMDQEVDDLCKEDDDDDDEDEDEEDDEEETESELDKRILKMKTPLKVPEIDSSTSSSEDSLSGGCHPKGWGEKKSRKRKIETTTCTETEYDEEFPSVKFRRGEPLPSDLDLGDESQDTPASEGGMDDVDDGEWNLMGAALERQFLSGK